LIGWYLVTIGGLMYIGPIDPDHCRRAAEALRAEGIVCMEPREMVLCRVPGVDSYSTVCPVFGFPEVRAK
jgi:hypothetical protein